MAELIQDYSARVTSDEGTMYTVRAYGEERSDGTWIGWLEFHPTDGGKPLATDQETSQPDRATLGYWASGLEPTYFEGALARAQGHLP